MKLYRFFRSLLFKLDPERAHHLTLRLIGLAGNIAPISSLLCWMHSVPASPVHAFGLDFQNPVGLAAGYDKDGLAWRGLACLGFGHIEIGTVTPKSQSGNPQPRLFRLQEEKALINRLGFPGSGAEAVLKHVIQEKPDGLILGVNIGKNKDTPLEAAGQDYVHLLQLFAPYVDYLTVNISSPNTIGLRRLQERESLERLLNQLSDAREHLLSSSRKVPVLVKISPDLSDSELDDALDVITANHMDGVIATNTTLAREGIDSVLASESGGLSGQPLFMKSLVMVSKIFRYTKGSVPVVGVGGIYDATSAQQMLDAGAVLIQLYTGLVYEGPGVVKRILSGLRH